MQLRQLLLVGLMACSLLGVQALQASPLHQHAQHSVECALCHLQFTDATLSSQSAGIAFIPFAPDPAPRCLAAAATGHTSPYQSRAPPAYFR